MEGILLSRRSFIKSILALSAVVAIPKEIIDNAILAEFEPRGAYKGDPTINLNGVVYSLEALNLSVQPHFSNVHVNNYHPPIQVIVDDLDVDLTCTVDLKNVKLVYATNDRVDFSIYIPEFDLSIRGMGYVGELETLGNDTAEFTIYRADGFIYEEVMT